MFPNFRLMAASTLVSIIVLFFAFGVYASFRVSHEPLGQPSRNAPLQLVGLNVAMLPITVLEPFAGGHSGAIATHSNSVLAYTGAQTSQPPLPVAAAGNAHGDNTAADAPAENSKVTQTNSDVTQSPETASLEAARETKSPGETMQDTAAPAEILPPSVTESATSATPPQAPVLPAPMESAAAPPPPVAPAALPPPAALAAPQNSPVEHTAVIETIPAANADDTALDDEIPVKDMKKKRVAKRHLYRVQPRAVAQTSSPQATSYPAAIGGPFVSAKGH